MKTSKMVLTIFLTMVWISISEFLRNQILFPHLWVEHYKTMGLIFPTDPVNGAMWGVWALVYASVLFVVSRKFSTLETFVLGWVIGFIMMWIVIGNLGVLPFGLLKYAIPLSLLETYLAVIIIKKTGGIS